MLVRAIEKYNYVKSYGIIELQKRAATESEITAYKIIIDNDIDYFKRQSIKAINEPIPEYLKVLEHFDSWDEAMMFLAKFKKEIPEELLYDKKN